MPQGALQSDLYCQTSLMSIRSGEECGPVVLGTHNAHWLPAQQQEHGCCAEYARLSGLNLRHRCLCLQLSCCLLSQCGRRICGGQWPSVPPAAIYDRGHHGGGSACIGCSCLCLTQTGPLQAGAAPATRPDGKPPEVFAPPRAYGFVNACARRRGGFGADLKLDYVSDGVLVRGTAMWGILHLGSPTGSAVHTLDGTVESAKSWRDEVSWWHASAGAHPAVCSWGRLWRYVRNRAGSRKADGAPAAPAPSLPPAAPLNGEVGVRVVIAMELCEAGARAQAPHPEVLRR